MKVLFVTTKNKAEARKISKALLDSRLVACCNIISGVESLYWRNWKIEESSECLLLCKTTLKKEKKAARLIKQLHSYDIPSIESFNLKHLNPEYKKWLGSQLKTPAKG